MNENQESKSSLADENLSVDSAVQSPETIDTLSVSSHSITAPVVAAKGSKKIPILLILVFNIVLAIFVFVTYFLITTILEEQKESEYVSTETTDALSTKFTIISPTAVLTSLPDQNPKENAIELLQKTSISDEPAAIKEDIEDTNLSLIDEVINSMDEELDYVFPTPFQ